MAGEIFKIEDRELLPKGYNKKFGGIVVTYNKESVGGGFHKPDFKVEGDNINFQDGNQWCAESDISDAIALHHVHSGKKDLDILIKVLEDYEISYTRLDVEEDMIYFSFDTKHVIQLILEEVYRMEDIDLVYLLEEAHGTYIDDKKNSCISEDMVKAMNEKGLIKKTKEVRFSNLPDSREIIKEFLVNYYGNQKEATKKLMKLGSDNGFLIGEDIL